MWDSSLYSISVLVILLSLCDVHACKHRWDYEPLSISVYSADESKINCNATIERVGRGVYAISAFLYLNFDMDETLMVEATAHRSFTGGEQDYVLVPWSIQKQTFKSFVKTHYDNLVYENFLSCSDVPAPANAYPWPKDLYKFEKCTSLCEGYPEILPQGYYKINFILSGQLDAGFTLIIKISSKTDIIG